jgi:hypothetical protein
MHELCSIMCDVAWAAVPKYGCLMSSPQEEEPLDEGVSDVPV